MLQEVKKACVHPALFSVFCLGLLSAPVMAQDTESIEGEAFEANVFEVFLGGTFDDGESNASFGLSFEFRVTESFGVGGLIEYTNGREWVYAIPFTMHVNEAWKVYVAPGFEHAEGENTYLTRVGTAYDFKFDGFALAPEVNLDFVDGDTKVVVGMSFVLEF